MKIRAFAGLLTLSALLAACGGGGGGGGGRSTPSPVPEPTPTPPVVTPVGFNISGTVSVSGNLSVGGDTNNPDELRVPNNSVATAQPVSNPATLGGYVNRPGTGDPGPLLVDGDSDDYFRIELLAGQTVTLLVADFERADADLYLFNLEGDILDSSIDVGELESLVIPEDGTYAVNVFSFEGATNYVLAIGTTIAPPGTAASALSGSSAAEIIPWQAIVKHHDGATDTQVAASREELNRRMGVRQRTGGGRSASRGPGRGQTVARRRPGLMAMEDPNSPGRKQANRLGTAMDRRAQFQDPAMRARWETLMTIKALRRLPGIASAEPNYRVRAMTIPNDEGFASQWHYPLINLPEAWEFTTGAPDVIVAVIDTGILAGHPDLAGQLVPGYDFIADPQRARDGTGIDPNPEDAGDSSDLGGSSFHGTHVSGTIAAASDNGTGVAGVAWNARIMPLRVLGLEGGSTYDVRQAIRYAAGLANDSDTVPDQPADIINLSLGGGAFEQASQALFNEVRQAGIMVVAAAGNEASTEPSYPASYNGVISVSAVDIQRQATRYTNSGSSIDVAAPGGNNGADLNGDGFPDGVLSTGGSVADSGSVNYVYSFLNGTSMASPHVAGVLALMKSVNPDLSPADIDALLELGELTEDLGAAGRDNLFGHGLINAQRAVVAALTAAGNPPADNPRLSASSALLNFGSAADSLDLVLQNNGKGELELLEISTTDSWLQTAAADIDDNGLGSYLVRIDREGLPSGIYGAKITAVSSVNTVVVDVLISVVDQAFGGNVGTVYMLLIDTRTQEVAGQFGASPTQGLYRYQFNDIPEGSYEIFAGSDADNDLLICDPGEACGSYLTRDQPIVIDLDSDLQGLEFPVEYRVAIPTVNSQSLESTRASEPGISRAP